MPQVFHQGFLVFRQNPCMNFIYSKLQSDGFRCLLIVTSRHDDPEPEAMKIVNGTGRGFFDRVSDCDDPGETTINCYEHGSLSRRPQVICSMFSNRMVHIDFVHQCWISESDIMAVNLTSDTFASDSLEVCCFKKRQALLSCTLHNRLRKGVL